MLKQTYELTESAIKSLGINVEDCRGENQGQWNLKKGQFDILVDVWEEQNQVLFQVLCPLCALPDENREAFFLYLLNKNHELSSVAYTIFENNVYIKHTREAVGLNMEEIINLLTKAAFYAELSDFVPAE